MAATRRGSLAWPPGELSSHDSVRPEQLAETAYLTSFMKRQRHADPTFQHLTCSCLLATYVSSCALPLQPPRLHSCSTSFAICRHGPAGTSATKPALHRALPRTVFETHRAAQCRKHCSLATPGCVCQVRCGPAWKPLEASMFKKREEPAKLRHIVPPLPGCV